MPTFSTLDAKLLNDAIGTVNENLTVHHKENATTLQQICKDLGEHFTPQLYALDRIEKKLNRILERLSPTAQTVKRELQQDLVLEIKRVADSIPEETKEALRNGSWQLTPEQEKALKDHQPQIQQRPFISKPNQFNIHHKDSPSFQESNGVQGEPCQSDQVSELKRTIERLDRSQLQEKEKDIQGLQRTASHLAEKEALARQQLRNKSQELENLHQAYSKEVQTLSETLNALEQERNAVNRLKREKEDLKKEMQEEGEELEKYFKLYNELRHTAQKQVNEQFAEIQQLKDTIVKMQMEKHSSIVSVVSGRSPQSNEDQTSK